MSHDDASRLHLDESQQEAQLEEKLHSIELARQEQLTRTRAEELHLGYIDLKGFPIGPEVLTTISEEQSRESKTICFFRNDEEIRIGTVNSKRSDVQAILTQLAKQFPDRRIGLYLISPHSFDLAFEFYAHVSKPRKVQRDLVITEEEIERLRKEFSSFEEFNARLQTVNVTEIFALLLAAAINADASDIHIEAEEDSIVIRLRIDGVLQQVASMPSDFWPKIISRLKVIAGLKINVTDVPQDGRITIKLGKDKTDIRVSTLPSAYGESVVMRLLRSTATGLQFEDLGVRGRAVEELQRAIQTPNGMIVTTGPTGSGKTTTLYAILNKLNTPDQKIITLENPIEYKLKGITQSQIEEAQEKELEPLQPGQPVVKRGYTFAKGLRAILRQDPDIIMVGEIRDLETAEVAIQAALTGHLLISTIHTNDAAGAIPRFLSMGAKPFLLAPALRTIIGQRLVRRICASCKQEMTLEGVTLERVKKILSEIPEGRSEKSDLSKLHFYEGRGCDVCHQLKYKGRIGIYEVLSMSEEIEKVILSGAVSEYDMRAIAKKQGMITMIQDGLLKALDGITTVEEVFRVAAS
jgi:type IV pilus assembly protein PilB